MINLHESSHFFQGKETRPGPTIVIFLITFYECHARKDIVDIMQITGLLGILYKQEFGMWFTKKILYEIECPLFNICLHLTSFDASTCYDLSDGKKFTMAR